MLTLTRRRWRSIYSLSAKGGEVKGYMGLGPKLCADRYRTCAGGPVVRWLMRDRSSGVAGRPLEALCEGAPDVQKFHSSVNFHSVDRCRMSGAAGRPLAGMSPDVRSGPVIHSL